MSSMNAQLTCPNNPTHTREPNDRGHYFCRACARGAGRRGGEARVETARRQQERTEAALGRRREIMPDYDKKLEEWLS